VGRRIVARVGLGLNDPAPDPVDKQDGSNQLARNRHRITREEGLWQRWFHPSFRFRGPIEDA
jgi:hypothetical protein